ncbi:MAG TPA: hypothetical protein VLK84_19905 [Longimicrobium sp.]|nr:hypothetical protein [Longimicrobium sp.]
MLLPGDRGVSGPAEQLLDGLERGGPAYGWERFLALVREHPDALPSFVEGGLRRRLSGVRFVGDAISYLPESAVAPLAELAVRLHAPAERHSSDLHTRSASELVLERVALQFPRLLHPWLTELFEQEVNFDRDVGTHPWRESGERHHAYLLDVVRTSGVGERSHRALECLLETRTPAAFRAVERHEEELAYGNVPLPHGAQLDRYLPAVGYERAQPGEGEWRRLYPEASYHLAFPAGYLPVYASWGREHPTYHLHGDDAVPARFGGAGTAQCSACGRQAHHLLTLDPVPACLGVTSVSALSLETCLHCIWENSELWWKHDEAGRPAAHPQQGEENYGDTKGPLRATTVRLVPTPARWYWQDARYEQENLTRVGGYPSWMESADFPSCPDCERRMPFLFQLDCVAPGEPSADGPEFFGDDGEPLETVGEPFSDGILYTFWCDGCRVSISIPQAEG